MSGPADPTEAILAMLCQVVSPPTARSMLNIALIRTGVAGGALKLSDLARLVEQLCGGLRLFVTDPEANRACRKQLMGLVQRSSDVAAETPRAATMQAPQGPTRSLTPQPRQTKTIAITCEDDLRMARAAARTMAMTVFASSVWQTRVVTIVSELVRNIVQYAGEGEVAIRTLDLERAIEIVALDQGPGIAHLDDVMKGDYRSRSGMGLGLRGVKSICSEFEIRCPPGQGTYVRARLSAS